MQYSKEESKAIWNQNAEFWDCAMGDESNDFHREVVRPKVTELLNPDPTDYILDIACGNGNYSAYLAEKAVSVLAFDYSEKMVELAKKRQKRYADNIEFCVADATNETSLMALKRNKPFTAPKSATIYPFNARGKRYARQFVATPKSMFTNSIVLCVIIILIIIYIIIVTTAYYLGIIQIQNR